MDEREVAELIDRFNAAWGAHDLDAAMALCTDDVLFDSTGPAPDGASARGPAEVRAAWAPIFADAKAHFETEEAFAAGDRFVQLWRYDWGDGHVRGVDVFSVRDGKVAQKLSYVKG
jgi:ketosteroid isomerase-like protein